jgi:hypothetical protein
VQAPIKYNLVLNLISERSRLHCATALLARADEVPPHGHIQYRSYTSPENNRAPANRCPPLPTTGVTSRRCPVAAAPAGLLADPRLRADARGGDGGIREKLAGKVPFADKPEGWFNPVWTI